MLAFRVQGFSYMSCWIRGISARALPAAKVAEGANTQSDPTLGLG